MKSLLSQPDLSWDDLSESPLFQDSPICNGCHTILAPTRHRTPDYIQASTGCWSQYRELVARHQNLYNCPRYYRLLVDTYAVQHLKLGSVSQCKMAALHLISLFLVVEKSYGPNSAVVAMKQVVGCNGDYELLTLPANRDEQNVPTVLDIRGARTPAAYEEALTGWGEAVWHSWQEHHSLIRHWAGF